ncbi:DUF1924 domain-containing protein [Zoogloea sp.]|uniref:DUF1924 domain-containing protein n=1 Tax=Zoogloea sp. TaxID=49181 RepID=UPI0026370EDF|nr:DUF1924 domain-containing protein [Zoogloea sp.]MDD3353912.1 DUF1924 domain-containing protein [Zoogloea sp.]
MKRSFLLALFLVSGGLHAETPGQILQHYASEAGKTQPGFTASAQRGERLYRQAFSIAEGMPACTSCHTDAPTRTGQHAITGKRIQPLAVAANSERFTEPAKVEKWFGRNCREIIGRPCTASEKADFIAFMSEVR